MQKGFIFEKKSQSLWAVVLALFFTVTKTNTAHLSLWGFWFPCTSAPKLQVSAVAPDSATELQGGPGTPPTPTPETELLALFVLGTGLESHSNSCCLWQSRFS